MNKNNKLNRSQKAHERLMNYHLDKTNSFRTGADYDKHFVKMQYHSRCLHEQSIRKCVLSDAHKKFIYNDVIRTLY